MLSKIRKSPSGKESTLLTEPLVMPARTSYFVDPASGSDGAVGSAEAPLATLAELSRRLWGSLITEDVTATLLSDAASDDRLDLQCAMSAEANLTISGAATTVASFTIVSATEVPPTSGDGYVWDIETSGIDWTAQTARRIELPTGEVGWIIRVIDADNVRVSAFVTRANTSVALATPAAGPAVLQTLPVCAAPVINIAPGQIGRHDVSQSVIRAALTDLSLTQDEDDTVQMQGICRLYGCDIKTVGINLSAIARIESCRINVENLNGAGISSMRVNGAGDYQLVGSLVTTSRSAGPAPFHVLQARGNIRDCAFFRVCLTVTNGGTCEFSGNGCYFEGAYAFAALSIENGASASAPAGVELEGSVDGAGHAIIASTGGRLFYVATPSISGAGTADTQVGGVNVAYASLPSVATSTAAITTNS